MVVTNLSLTLDVFNCRQSLGIPPTVHGQSDLVAEATSRTTNQETTLYVDALGLEVNLCVTNDQSRAFWDPDDAKDICLRKRTRRDQHFGVGRDCNVGTILRDRTSPSRRWNSEGEGERYIRACQSNKPA